MGINSNNFSGGSNLSKDKKDKYKKMQSKYSNNKSNSNHNNALGSRDCDEEVG
jgi:hypothetical protein